MYILSPDIRAMHDLAYVNKYVYIYILNGNVNISLISNIQVHIFNFKLGKM